MHHTEPVGSHASPVGLWKLQEKEVGNIGEHRGNVGGMLSPSSTSHQRASFLIMLEGNTE